MESILKLSHQKSEGSYTEKVEGVKVYRNMNVSVYGEEGRHWTVNRETWNCNGTIYVGSITSYSWMFTHGRTRFYDTVEKFDAAIKRLQAKKEIHTIAAF